MTFYISSFGEELYPHTCAVRRLRKANHNHKLKPEINRCPNPNFREQIRNWYVRYGGSYRKIEAIKTDYRRSISQVSSVISIRCTKACNCKQNTINRNTSISSNINNNNNNFTKSERQRNLNSKAQLLVHSFHSLHSLHSDSTLWSFLSSKCKYLVVVATIVYPIHLVNELELL